VDSQTTTYALDLNAGLTQVLDDGDNTYLYGLGRISQVNTGTQYFMGDALGSVRQLVEGGDIVLAKSYAPYGEVLSTAGSGESAFALTGEQTDPNGLVYLRARYYGPSNGRFLSRDTWTGDVNSPMSYNPWLYAFADPVNNADPSGLCSGSATDVNNADIDCWKKIESIEASYSNINIDSDNWQTDELESVKKALDGIAFTLGGNNNFILVYNKTITLYRAGWFISLITGSVQGRTAVGPGTVTIYDDAFADSYDLGTAVVIHEFGHLFDARFGYLSMADSFRNKFWSDCEPNIWGDDCKRFFHNPQCEGLPASPSYARASPKEDFAELFAYYVWDDNGWDVTLLFEQFMPPDPDRMSYMENLISTIKADL
jgi:RHS repeat-associated protein